MCTQQIHLSFLGLISQQFGVMVRGTGDIKAYTAENVALHAQNMPQDGPAARPPRPQVSIWGERTCTPQQLLRMQQ
jgi:hypothetical protein